MRGPGIRPHFVRKQNAERQVFLGGHQGDDATHGMPHYVCLFGYAELRSEKAAQLTGLNQALLNRKPVFRWGTVTASGMGGSSRAQFLAGTLNPSFRATAFCCLSSVTNVMALGSSARYSAQAMCQRSAPRR